MTVSTVAAWELILPRPPPGVVMNRQRHRAIMLDAMAIPRLPRPFLRFLHKGLGLKNFVDYIEQRQSLLGLTNLDIRTVIDIGANKGGAARGFLGFFPNAKIYCIEPIPKLCRRLEEWARVQGLAVEVLQVALSCERSEQSLYVDKRNDIWSTLLRPSPEKSSQYDQIQVHVDTLDNVASELALAGDVLVKIDTEGLDLQVIRGGEATLRRSTAVIVESVFYPSPLGDDAPTFEDISSALRELGYVYRGNVRLGCHQGTPMLADVLFVRRDAAERMVEGA